MAESLAVRHRPRRFADVAGQRHIGAVLRSAAARQSPPQQILLAGGSGLGKTTLARIFAAALFCADRAADGDACGVCESCQQVTGAGGFHPDVIELDAASTGGKDEIRELAARASLAPLLAKWKVYIIDEAHGLTSAGGQAFLKTLEEPPAHTLFVFATTDPDKLPAAIRGRCSIHEVLAPTPEEVAGNLRRIGELEQWPLDDVVIDAILAATDPALGMRGTVMTLEKLAGAFADGGPVDADTLEAVLGTVSPDRLAPLTSAILTGDRSNALLALADLTGRVGGSHLRRQLSTWARGLLLDACRARRGADEAYHRYEVLTLAGSYDGALEVAVAKMATPEFDDSAAAVRALLERAESTLARLAQAGTPPTTGSSTTPIPPVHEAPAATSEAPAPAAPPGGPSAVAYPATSAAPVPTPTAEPVTQGVAQPVAGVPVVGVPVGPGDPQFNQMLNAVGKAAPRVATVLRRCVIVRDAEGLAHVTVPLELRERADDVGLHSVVARLVGDGTLSGVAAAVA